MRQKDVNCDPMKPENMRTIKDVSYTYKMLHLMQFPVSFSPIHSVRNANI